MKKLVLSIGFVGLTATGFAQLSPAITHWLQNNTVTGTYYVSGNSTPISNGILVNCQEVSYTATDVYIRCTGVPAYPTGPFQDGNPSVAEDQSAIYKFPLNPTENTGTPDATIAGNIGVFINGVALYDYRDGVAWDPTNNAPCGGPGNSPCPGGPGAVMDWNRDAIPAEMDGFDCSKGHPAMGSYHHHQNPSAFDMDLTVVSNICNLYDADGMYAIDSTQHSPLLGFAYDGFPIYGAYGFRNADGSGGITRIKSGYQLRNITQRTHHADGTDVDDGPAVDATYFLGYFREDYEFMPHPNQEEFLDEHNGRFCVTPEYPNGTYAYFCTVDDQWNSAYPYAVGPTFYGHFSDAAVTSVPANATVFNGSVDVNENAEFLLDYNVFPNPATDLIVVQAMGLNKLNTTVELFDMQGRVVAQTQINAGQTLCHLNTETIYPGNYILRISNEAQVATHKVLIDK